MLTICLFPLSFISASQVIKNHLSVIQKFYSKTKLQLRFYHAKVFIFVLLGLTCTKEDSGEESYYPFN